MPNERLAVVTGSSAGIGRAIAARLLADGWRVTGLDRSAPSLAGPGFAAVEADLADAAALRELAAALPPATAVVHAAGTLHAASLGGLDDAAGERMWQLHVRAATVLADRLLPDMARRGHGRMVLIGSRVAQGMPGRSQYAACKAALVALARSWAAEVVARGVTVNVVSPAATQTAMLSDPARRGSPPRLPPLGRLIRAEEVAAMVAFLLSDDAAAVTGQDIQVCGGASLPS